ncbi:MAG TPA: hypothetical protein VGO40_13975 [Longimicrobium sp.]|jgi:hypothetical protein|nr:hypothetical protein [Longimicrobium sp.]
MSTRRAAALPLAGFGLIAVGVYATLFVLASSRLFERAPGLGSFGITFDLLVTIPAAFYLMVVRPRKLPWLTVVPCVIASAWAGVLVLPPEHRQLLHAARFLIAPAELWLVGYGGLRAWRLLRSGTHPGRDVPEAVHAALHEIVRYPAVADAVAAEVTLFWFAFLSWRSRPRIAPGATEFTQHLKSGIPGIVGAVSFACVIEAVGVHLLAARWSSTVAWALTGLSAYGVIWLMGLGRSAVLRPTMVEREGLRVRIGALYEAVVPFDAIERVRMVRSGPENRRAPGYLHASLFAAPRLMIELKEPVEARGLYGNRKLGITRIGLLVDEPAELAALLRERMAAPHDAGWTSWLGIR